MIIKSLLKVLVEKEMIWQRRNIVCKGKDSVNYVQLFSESHLTMTSFFITVYYFYVKKKEKISGNRKSCKLFYTKTLQSKK